MSENIDLVRRSLAACGLLAASGWRHAGALATLSRADSGSTQLAQLKYGQVQFDSGALSRQALENHRFVLSLDEDALLRPFRVRAGQPAPGRNLGGWYDTYAFAPWCSCGSWARATRAGSSIPRANLLVAQRKHSAKHEWQAKTDGGFRTLKPFLDIGGEDYSVYQDVV
jgi:hypothetical protein